MKKIISHCLIVFLLTGCTATKLNVNYNPSNLPVEKLATIKPIKKSLSESFANPGNYKVDFVDGVRPLWSHDSFRGFEPGVHVFGWREVEFINYGNVTRALGLLVANLKSGKHYTIGIRPNGDGDVEIWDTDTLIPISKSCIPSDCYLVRDEMKKASNTEKK